MSFKIFPALIMFLLIPMPTQSRACPQRCTCLFGYITCSDLKAFPTDFPTNTNSIDLNSIDVDEIPEAVFTHLVHLESVTIESSFIGRISSKAVSNLSSVNEIVFSDIVVGSIDSYAFSDLSDIGTLAFRNASIDDVKPHAFSNLFAFDDIELGNVDIRNLHTNAFHDISDVLNLKLTKSSITEISQPAFTELVDIIELTITENDIASLPYTEIELMLEQAESVSFFANNVTCDCDLLDFLKTHDVDKYSTYNWCSFQGELDLISWYTFSNDMIDCDRQPMVQENDAQIRPLDFDTYQTTEPTIDDPFAVTADTLDATEQPYESISDKMTSETSGSTPDMSNVQSITENPKTTKSVKPKLSTSTTHSMTSLFKTAGTGSQSDASAVSANSSASSVGISWLLVFILTTFSATVHEK